MEPRTCQCCKKTLVKRDDETKNAFARRKYCNHECATGPSEVRIYPSRFGGGWLTAQLYLTENMCDRSAKRSGVTLPDKFWEKEQWKSSFSSQVRYAASLLSKYSVQAIIAALRTPQGKNVFSLSANWLEPLIHNEQKRLDRAMEKAKEYEPPKESEVVIEKPREAFVPQKSTMSSLKGL